MRIFVLAVLLFTQFSFVSFAQQFPFIPWNTTPNDAKIFLQKEGFSLYKETPSSTNKVMTFTQSYNYGYSSVTAYLYFKEQVLTNVKYDTFSSSSESLDLWESYTKETSNKFGAPVKKEYTVPADTKSRLIGHIMYGNAKASVTWEFNNAGEPSRIESFIGKDGNVHVSIMDLSRHKPESQTTETEKATVKKVQQLPTVSVSINDYQTVLSSLPRLGEYGSLPSFMDAVMADGSTGIFSGTYNNLKIEAELRNGRLTQLTIGPNGKAEEVDSAGLIDVLTEHYGSATYKYPTNYRWVFSSHPIRSLDLLPDKGEIMGIWQ